ncbi:MAG: YlxM family DNA-binding protein [Lachnospiraceae bacterium]|nr:YlxM family DNA-binding protein [Lachnospiraceae bacterium]
MEKIYQQALLYDFYGELLTEHQRSIYEDAVCNDLSLGEIAQERGISRQGVHDLIRRCDKALQEYETRLRLVEKFVNARDKVERIITLAQTEGFNGRERGAALMQEPKESGAQERETTLAQESERHADRLREIYSLATELRQEL